MAIASPILGTKIAIKKEMLNSPKVQMKFCLVVNDCSFGNISSSIASLVGNMLNGVANTSTKRKVSKQILMSTEPP